MPKASRRWQARWPPTSAAIGDVRDLYQQSGNYRGRRDVDTTTVALAAVGITLTVATVVFARRDAAREGRRQH